MQRKKGILYTTATEGDKPEYNNWPNKSAKHVQPKFVMSHEIQQTQNSGYQIDTRRKCVKCTAVPYNLFT